MNSLVGKIAHSDSCPLRDVCAQYFHVHYGCSREYSSDRRVQPECLIDNGVQVGKLGDFLQGRDVVVIGHQNLELFLEQNILPV